MVTLAGLNNWQLYIAGRQANEGVVAALFNNPALPRGQLRTVLRAGHQAGPMPVLSLISPARRGNKPIFRYYSRMCFSNVIDQNTCLGLIEFYVPLRYTSLTA